MVQIKITLDQPTYERLVERAGDERRPPAWQAEVELQRALQRPTNGQPTADRAIRAPRRGHGAGGVA